MRRHPNIEMLAYTDIEEIQGYIGDFRVRVRKRARYVREDECTACGDCAKVCPVLVPDEYQQGFSTRKAIYIPFPQAVPSAYVLDMANCLGNNPVACGKCLEACEKKCIDYDMTDQVLEFQAGVIIVATGMEVYNPAHLDEFGYTRFENVLTSLEFERLLNVGGPTEGNLVRPSDMKVPKRIGFIQCVGSRSKKRGNPYCSNICCMNTVKDTLLLKDHYPDVQSQVFYMDMRTFGRGFEEMFQRSKEEGVQYIRGIPGEVVEDPKTRNLTVRVENTTTGRLETMSLDMLVLAVGGVPNAAGKDVVHMLSLSRGEDGFLLEAHPKLRPVDGVTRGVYLAGCAEAPKDVKESVTQASAAAARASILLNAGKVPIEAITAQVVQKKCTLCGLCVRVCPYKAITASNKKEGVFPQVIEAACAGCGTCAAECRFDAISMRHFRDDQIRAQIDGVMADRPEEKILVFACNWCSFAGGDTAGTARLQFPSSARLVRTMCSGRVSEEFVLRGFRLGAPIVLVSGCHFSDCHYINAVTWTQRRVERLWNKLEKWGIRPERLQLEWISAAEGKKFARVMEELETMRATVTREEIEETKRILANVKKPAAASAK
ncbi:MAG: hydrogenase iron-sulfur subunit [Planctomycetota bacterium]